MVEIQKQCEQEASKNRDTAGNDETTGDEAVGFGLKLVRKDDRRNVYTEHPDIIHPKALEKFLLGKFKRHQLNVFLMRNIYIVYIDRELESNSSSGGNNAKLDWKQKSSDMMDALEVVNKARIDEYCRKSGFRGAHFPHQMAV